MTNDEIKIRRNHLEYIIQRMIKQFELETSLIVSDIKYTRLEVWSEGVLKSMTAERDIVITVNL